MDNDYKELVEGGFVPFKRGNDWLEKALDQHNPNISLALATSAEIILPRRLDFMDFFIAVKEDIDGRYN